MDVDTVILIVKDRNETNATGCYGIALKFIRDALPVISFYLTITVNTSIVTGSYPLLWKHAIVVPFHKSGDAEDVNNYRPVSLLPILSKILEKIVSKQLMDYLETNKLLSNTQHGFRPKLSTETALLKVSDYIYEKIDKKKIVLLALCDLSKACDTIDHDILLKKCQC